MIEKDRVLRLNCPGYGEETHLNLGRAKTLENYQVIIANPVSLLHLFDKGPEPTRRINQLLSEGNNQLNVPDDALIQELINESDARLEELIPFLSQGGLLVYFLCRPFVLAGPTISVDNYDWLSVYAPAMKNPPENGSRQMSSVSHGRIIEPTDEGEQSEMAEYFQQQGVEWNTIIRTDFLSSNYSVMATAGSKKCIAAQFWAGDNGGKVIFLPAPYSPDFDRVLMSCVDKWYQEAIRQGTIQAPAAGAVVAAPDDSAFRRPGGPDFYAGEQVETAPTLSGSVPAYEQPVSAAPTSAAAPQALAALLKAQSGTNQIVDPVAAAEADPPKASQPPKGALKSLFSDDPLDDDDEFETTAVAETESPVVQITTKDVTSPTLESNGAEIDPHDSPIFNQHMAAAQDSVVDAEPLKNVEPETAQVSNFELKKATAEMDLSQFAQTARQLVEQAKDIESATREPVKPAPPPVQATTPAKQRIADILKGLEFGRGSDPEDSDDLEPAAPADQVDTGPHGAVDGHDDNDKPTSLAEGLRPNRESVSRNWLGTTASHALPEANGPEQAAAPEVDHAEMTPAQAILANLQAHTEADPQDLPPIDVAVEEKAAGLPASSDISQEKRSAMENAGLSADSLMNELSVMNELNALMEESNAPAEPEARSIWAPEPPREEITEAAPQAEESKVEETVAEFKEEPVFKWDPEPASTAPVDYKSEAPLKATLVPLGSWADAEEPVVASAAQTEEPKAEEPVVAAVEVAEPVAQAVLPEELKTEEPNAEEIKVEEQAASVFAPEPASEPVSESASVFAPEPISVFAPEPVQATEAVEAPQAEIAASAQEENTLQSLTKDDSEAEKNADQPEARPQSLRSLMESLGTADKLPAEAPAAPTAPVMPAQTPSLSTPSSESSLRELIEASGAFDETKTSESVPSLRLEHQGLTPELEAPATPAMAAPAASSAPAAPSMAAKGLPSLAEFEWNEDEDEQLAALKAPAASAPPAQPASPFAPPAAAAASDNSFTPAATPAWAAENQSQPVTANSLLESLVQMQNPVAPTPTAPPPAVPFVSYADSNPAPIASASATHNTAAPLSSLVPQAPAPAEAAAPQAMSVFAPEKAAPEVLPPPAQAAPVAAEAPAPAAAPASSGGFNPLSSQTDMPSFSTQSGQYAQVQQPAPQAVQPASPFAPPAPQPVQPTASPFAPAAAAEAAPAPVEPSIAEKVEAGEGSALDAFMKIKPSTPSITLPDPAINSAPSAEVFATTNGGGDKSLRDDLTAPVSATPQPEELIRKMQQLTSNSTPSWCTDFSFPFIEHLRKEHAQLAEQLRQVQSALNGMDARIETVETLKMALLTGEQDAFLSACQEILTRVGWQVQASRTDPTELWLVRGERVEAIARVVRSQTSTNRTELAQLAQSVIAFWDKYETEPKGILLAQNFAHQHPSERQEPDFAATLVEAAAKKGLCLMSSLQLLGMFKEGETGQMSADEMRKRVLETSGKLSGFALDASMAQAAAV